MRGWFGPMPGTNVGYGGVWQTYNVIPVRWQGWLATLVYFAVQFGAAWAEIAFLSELRWLGLGMIIQVIVLHLVYLWFASRHYVTRDEIDPYSLLADMRDGKPNE